MSNSYKPAFDSSTLYFANQSLEWLVNPPKDINFDTIFYKIRENKIWEKSSDEDSLYKKLNQMFMFENGATVDESGLNLDNYTSGRNSTGHIYMQMIFGLISLSKVIESIVLGEEINFLRHPGAARVKSLDEAGKNFILPGYKDLWKTVELTDEEKEAYIQWSGEIADEAKYISKIEEIVIELFAQPYMSFGATLFDISNGVEHVLTAECTSANEGFRNALYMPEIEKHLPTNTFMITQADVAVAGRTFSYLTNGLFYKYISNIKEIDYVPNEYRSPLLDILASTKDINDKERIFEIISHIAGEMKKEDKDQDSSEITWSFQEDIDIENLIFAAVISTAGSASSIMETAYKMREELSSLRDEISKNGINEKMKNDLNDLLKRRIKHKNGIDFKTKQINIPIQGTVLDFLLKPRYIGSKKHLTSINMLVDKYESMIALTEILSKFTNSKD